MTPVIASWDTFRPLRLTTRWRDADNPDYAYAWNEDKAQTATGSGRMTPTALAPRLLERLFDDASQFPPGDLDLEPAVEEHARWRQDPHAWLVGRLLTPAARIGDLAQRLATDAAAWDLGLIVSAEAGADAAAEALEPTLATVTAVELPLAAGAAAIEAWRRAFPDAELYLEGRAGDLPRIAELGARAKLRCGGLTAGAVPDAATVAAFLRGCAELDLPFKATAGLHQPLRHFAADVGAVQHGFLNLLAATARAIAGARAAELESALEATDHRSLELGSADLVGARRLFTAFGTCSIREPIEGLEALGLLPA